MRRRGTAFRLREAKGPLIEWPGTGWGTHWRGVNACGRSALSSLGDKERRVIPDGAFWGCRAPVSEDRLGEDRAMPATIL